MYFNDNIMIDIATYQTMSHSDKEDLFYNFLVPMVTPGTARSYSKKWMNFSELTTIVQKRTGQNSLYDVIDITTITKIRDEDLIGKDVNSRNGKFPSATVSKYELFIQELRSGGIITTHNCTSHTSATAVKSAIPVNPNYVKANEIIKSSVPSDLEKELFENIINHRMHLNSISVCFADIINQLDLVFSPDKKEREEFVGIDALQKQLDVLKEERIRIRKEIENSENESKKLRASLAKQGIPPYESEQENKLSYQRQLLYIKEDHIITQIHIIENAIRSGETGLVQKTKILGEFISLPNPTVVLYYNNIDNEYSTTSRYEKLCGTFVHEMFHAWNYFMAGKNSRSVLVVDEPMVEFASLVFLEDLHQKAVNSNTTVTGQLNEIFNKRLWLVKQKQREIGSTAAYGFGAYLYENIGTDNKRWIEEYSWKSAIIPKNSSKVKKIEELLIPCFPAGREDVALKAMEKIIFDKIGIKTTSHSSIVKSGSNVQPNIKDLMIACIETLLQPYFSLYDIERYEKILQVVFPLNKNLKDDIQQILEDLVSDGYLEKISSDIYRKI